MLTCRTCGRSVHSPWRVYDDTGRVLYGCVSMDHDGRLVTPSESARWHNRKEAKAIRRAERARCVPLADADCDCGWLTLPDRRRAVSLHAATCAVRMVQS